MVARQIFAGLDVGIDSDYHTPDELMEFLGSASLVISTRMHLAIMSLIVGCPVIAIAYEFKTLELFESLDLSRYVIDMNSVSAEWLVSTAQDVVKEGATVLTDEVLAHLARRADTPALALDGVLNATRL